MKFSKYNPEGYYGPTAYEAFTNIETERRIARFRPIVYVCSPYAGDTDANTQDARRYCRFAVDNGYIPLAPHLFFPQFMNDADPQERNLAMFMNMALMSKCAEVWVFGEYISKGMAVEIRKAKEKRQPIRYFSTECKEVF